MKLYNNILISLLITTLSVNGALAFGFHKNPNNVKKVEKIKKEEYEKAPFTNDIHSVFSL